MFQPRACQCRPRLVAGEIAVFLLALAASVHAQQPVMDEVIVTAQKRPEPLNHVPLSVAVVSGDKMMDAVIFDLGDLSIYIPNFQASPTPVGSYLVIRGIGSGVNQGFEQSVMMYVDDIALGRGRLAQIPFLDLKRVEVLRGPQNVLFGKNSLAGALSLVTNKPSPDFGGMVLAEYEPEYNTRHGQFIINGPLTDELRGRLALRYYVDDGYFDNNLNGEQEARREDDTWRGTLGWDISDAVDATLKISQTSVDTDGAPSEMVFGYANPIEGDPFFGLNYPETAQVIGTLVGYDIGSDDGRQNFRRNTNHDEVVKLDIDNVTLTANWVTEDFTLTSITGYVAYDTDMQLDLDGLGVDFVFSEEEDYDQFSQELRFTSSGGGSNEWIAGLYYQEWDLSASIDVSAADESLAPALAALGVFDPLPPDLFVGYLTRRDYTVDSKSLAAFAQSTWSISPFTRITLGGRYTVDDKGGVRRFKKLDFPVERVDSNRDEDYFTATAIVEWDVGEDSMLYASVANGYKTGGFDARSVRPDNFEYEDESVLALELGTKSRLLNDRLELNTALFYSDYDDLQVSQFDGLLGYEVGNADRATSKGIEIDGRLLLDETLILTFAAAYLDFEFDKFEDGTCQSFHTVLTGEKFCDYSGSTNIFAPEWSANLSLDYVTPLTPTIRFQATVDLHYRDEQFLDSTLNSDVAQEAYTKINGRLALNMGPWTMALVGKNLTDEDVSLYTYDASFSTGLNTPAYTSYMDRPRTITLQVRYLF